MLQAVSSMLEAAYSFGFTRVPGKNDTVVLDRSSSKGERNSPHEVVEKKGSPHSSLSL